MLEEARKPVKSIDKTNSSKVPIPFVIGYIN